MELFTEHFWQGMVGSVAFWFVSMFMLGISYVFLDIVIFRKIDFNEELKKGNMAVAIVIAAYLLGIAGVIYGVTN